jgi:hypothetical protein
MTNLQHYTAISVISSALQCFSKIFGLTLRICESIWSKLSTARLKFSIPNNTSYYPCSGVILRHCSKGVTIVAQIQQKKSNNDFLFYESRQKPEF